MQLIVKQHQAFIRKSNQKRLIMINKLKQILAVVLILTNIFSSCKKENDDDIKGIPPIIFLTVIEGKLDNVIIKGIVETNHSITRVFFEYGKTTDYEYSLPAEQNPIDGYTKTEVSIVLKNLEPATKYYLRIKAENQHGVSYSKDYEFKTVNTGLVGTIEDIEGNVYETIGIGYQMWMTENLKTTKYNDGTDIPLVTDNGAWDSLSTPAYCWYIIDSELHTKYTQTCGALYNWYAVETGKLCPNGWHVPTNSEWTELIDYFIGSSKSPVL
jgi:hypothetical protein